MRAGRKRKLGLRYPCGKLKREETEREAMATALAARQRHYGLTAKQARDERLGSSLGRLNVQGLISESQYDAGVKFARLYYSHHIISGLPTPTPQSISGLMIHIGLLESYGNVEADDTYVRQLRKQFETTTDALDQCDLEHRMTRGRKPSLLLYRVVCVDEDTTLWPECDLGNLRVALNTLARVFRC
jgi:hypothetical protein